MDLAALELQIFVSLAVVLGVAFVALVCDFLKGNNERLRERNIEYRVRESERGAGTNAAELLRSIIAIGRNPQLAERLFPGVKAEPAARAEPPVEAPLVEPERVTTWATKEELERLAERTARIRARHDARKAETDLEVVAAAPVPIEIVAEPEPAVEVAAPVEEPTLAPIEAVVETPVETSVETPPVEATTEVSIAAEPAPEPVVEKTPEPVAWESVLFTPEVSVALAEAPAAEETDVQKIKVLPIDLNADKYDPVPEATLKIEKATEADLTQVAAAEIVPEVVAEATAEESQDTKDANVPPGLHPVAALNSLIEQNGIFTGVAVSIGMNDFDRLRAKIAEPEGTDSLAAVETMIRGILEKNDFACRFQEDEYILLFPGETDAAAQRRLFQVSEKLWDFQLRSLGHLSVMFSWGGLELHGETMKEAVAAARERMFQTKRNRKGTIELKRKVVNG